MNDFNAIAPIYDALKWLIFWGRIEGSKKVFLNRIQSGDKILILGGGSGQVLTYLDELKLPLSIDYVETSEKMMRRAKNRKTEMLDIIFRHQNAMELENRQNYDLIIANYFLDLFESEPLDRLISQLKTMLKPNGKLMVADFQIKNRWHHLFSFVMHCFFRWVADLDSSDLKPIDEKLKKEGFSSIDSKEFYGDFIFSSIYTVE